LSEGAAADKDFLKFVAMAVRMVADGLPNAKGK